LRGQQP